MRYHPYSTWRFGASCLLAAVCSTAAQACAYPVRDAAFTDWPRGFGVLYLLYGDKDDAKTKAWQEKLQEAGKTYLAEANLACQEIDVKAASFAPKDFGLKETPAVLPCLVALLPEPGQELMRMSGEFDEARLRELVDSPARKTLRENLVKKVGVAIFLPGKDEAKNGDARKLLKETAAQFKQQLGQELEWMELNRADRGKQEWGLISQLLFEETPEPVVAMVFGRGKIVHDKLAGKDINPDNLWGLCSVPMGPCLCTVPPNAIGYEMVMNWPEALNQKIVLVGKAQEGEEEGLPGRPGMSAAEDAPKAAGTDAPGAAPEGAKTPPASPLASAPPVPVAQQLHMEPAPSLESSSARLLVAAGGIALALLVVGAWMWMLKKRRDAV